MTGFIFKVNSQHHNKLHIKDKCGHNQHEITEAFFEFFPIEKITDITSNENTDDSCGCNYKEKQPIYIHGQGISK